MLQTRVMLNKIGDICTPQSWADINASIIHVSNTIMFHHANTALVLIQDR